MVPDNVNHLVFDFGAVIIDIDVPLTYRAFARLSNRSEQEVQHLFESGAYRDYEIGKLSDEAFRQLIREALGASFSDATIDEAWNTLLIGVPDSRIQLLKQLAQHYHVHLLSNTNPIHIRECTRIIERQHGIANFRTLFEKSYMSYEIGLLKPHHEIYQYVLRDLNAQPGQVLFLDDNEANVREAAALGIHARKITPQHDIHFWLDHAVTRS
ncbi:MAG: HAD family phosphatase [Cytophagaceae bacterium]|nr:HAD family phosphatase [Cytophagaceae bacterium]